MNPSSIKNIIFDLGNVVIDIDPTLTSQAFNQFAHQSVESDGWQLIEHFKDYEKGLITDEDFRNSVRLALKRPDLSAEPIDEAWNALLLDIGQSRVNLLLNLKQHFRLFVLSNTNAIHIRKVNQILNQSTTYPSTLESLFEKAYYSYDVKLCKPDTSIYRLILENENLIPTETLFIDDKEENTKAASALNIQVFHLVAPTTILDVFSDYV